MDANGDDYEFVYDTTAGIPAVIAEVQPDDCVVYYIRDPGGSLIARVYGEDTPAVSGKGFPETTK